MFSEFTNSGYWLDAYEAQNEAMDRHMKKYGLEDQDWRPAMLGRMRQAQEER